MASSPATPIHSDAAPSAERGGRRRPASDLVGYYGIPPIHKAHWQHLITWYFYLGGISSGSYVVAAIADLVGHREDRALVRVGRYLSVLALIPCPVLLILDLGRPERFHHMLRVVKLRSPMSLGTWGLLLFGGFSGLSALIQAARDRLIGGRGRAVGALPARPIAAVGSLVGFFIGGYTGVLLGATAVPLWARNARLLGPLFLSSALSSACAAIGLVLACLPGRREGSLARVERAEAVAVAGEAIMLAALHVNSGRLAAPLVTGRLGVLHALGSVGAGIVAPMVIRAVGRRLGLPDRLTMILASGSALVGGFAVKHVMVAAGRASADDPSATFEFAGDGSRARPTDDGRAAPARLLADR